MWKSIFQNWNIPHNESIESNENNFWNVRSHASHSRKGSGGAKLSSDFFSRPKNGKVIYLLLWCLFSVFQVFENRNLRWKSKVEMHSLLEMELQTKIKLHSLLTITTFIIRDGITNTNWAELLLTSYWPAETKDDWFKFTGRVTLEWESDITHENLMKTSIFFGNFTSRKFRGATSLDLDDVRHL